MTEPPEWIARARDGWIWRGSDRPSFAVTPRADQESVWDYPRPPCLAPDTREVIVRWGAVEVARSRRAIRVLETSHPPSFYIPWDDVAHHLLQSAGGGSYCEWKGPASYWNLIDGDRRLPGVAWSYRHPLSGAESLANCVAFYPAQLQCTVDSAPVRPQPGAFYGGWITPELVGPFKGEPGSTGW